MESTKAIQTMLNSFLELVKAGKGTDPSRKLTPDENFHIHKHAKTIMRNATAAAQEAKSLTEDGVDQISFKLGGDFFGMLNGKKE